MNIYEQIESDLSKLRHMLGIGSHNRKTEWGYRNYYVAGPSDIPAMERMIEAGLVEHIRGSFYRATRKGAEHVGLTGKQLKRALGDDGLHQLKGVGMTDLTHAEKAQEWLDEAPVQLRYEEQAGISSGRSLLTAQLAIAEAQLAVAEQLRIANLMTLAYLESHHDLASLSSEGLYGLVEYRTVQKASSYQNEDEAPFLRPEIAKALGVYND